MWNVNGVQLHRTPFAHTVHGYLLQVRQSQGRCWLKTHTIQLASCTRIQILDRIPRLIWIWCIHCIRVAANSASLESNARKTGRDIAGKNSIVPCVRVRVPFATRTTLSDGHIFSNFPLCVDCRFKASGWLAGDRLLNSIYVYYFIFRFAATF